MSFDLDIDVTLHVFELDDYGRRLTLGSSDVLHRLAERRHE